MTSRGERVGFGFEKKEREMLRENDCILANLIRIDEKRIRRKKKTKTHQQQQTNNKNSCKDVVVPARDRAVVPTGLAIAAPHGTYARVAPRSGLAVKKFIDTGAGVVDEDYRGEVGVVLFNHSSEDFHGEKMIFFFAFVIFSPFYV